MIIGPCGVSLWVPGAAAVYCGHCTAAAGQYEGHVVPCLGKPIAAGHNNVPNPAARPHDVK